jgi:hypothetical protein
MAWRRFAVAGGPPVTLHRTLAIAVVAAVTAASLAGCATSPIPSSAEEQIWFDRAVAYEIHKISPQARIDGLVGYPRTDRAR